jgi:RecA-family ATPase
VRASIEAWHVKLTPHVEPAKPKGSHGTSEVVFEPICAGTLLSKPAPPRCWLVPGWIPKNAVTLLGGDGGVGKSTLALQLGIAVATGTTWLGAEVEKTRTFVLSAEDDQDEMHFRLEKILDGLPGNREANRAALEDNFWFLDATEKLDPTLATYDAASRIAPTATYTQIAEFSRANSIGLFIVDSAADVFAEEINRHAVRSFIRELNAIGCTVVLLGHPSVDGIKSGRGYSGSTHWNNAVRSRLYFARAEAANGNVPDPDLRILDMPKANRARAGQKMILRWTASGFVRDDAAASGPGDLTQQRKAEEVFLRLLKRYCEQNRAPSHKQSPSYAPAVFASNDDREGITKAAFAKAMDRLFAAEKIEAVPEGPPSRRYYRLRVKGDQVKEDQAVERQDA